MAGQTLALADAVLKEDYKGPLRTQINNGVKILAQLEKNTDDIVGRRAVIPCHVSRNTGVGARLEGEVMPAAGNQGTVDAYVPVRSLYGRVRLTKQVITRMASDRGAFKRATKLEMDGLRDDCTVDTNRQVCGISTGALANCGTTTAANEIVLQTTTPEQILLFIREGMRLDIGTAANPQLIASDRLVTAVNLSTSTVTVDGAPVTTTSSHYLFRQGSGGTGNSQRELTGLQTHVAASGTHQSIDPSTYPSWASLVDTAAANRPLSENLVERIFQRSENRSGKTADSLWAEDGVYRFAANQIKARQRIVNTLELKGGHKGIDYTFGAENAALMRERFLETNALYGLHHASLVEYVDEDWSWEDEDGQGVLHLSPDSTHTFEAIFYKFAELGVLWRNANWLIKNLETA